MVSNHSGFSLVVQWASWNLYTKCQVFIVHFFKLLQFFFLSLMVNHVTQNYAKWLCVMSNYWIISSIVDLFGKFHNSVIYPITIRVKLMILRMILSSATSYFRDELKWRELKESCKKFCLWDFHPVKYCAAIFQSGNPKPVPTITSFFYFSINLLVIEIFRQFEGLQVAPFFNFHIKVPNSNVSLTALVV